MNTKDINNLKQFTASFDKFYSKKCLCSKKRKYDGTTIKNCACNKD